MTSNERFQELRNDQKLTQEEFGNLLKLSTFKIRDIENNRNNLSVEIAILIEDIFNINMRWLLTGKGSKYIEELNQCFKEEIREVILILKNYEKKGILENKETLIKCFLKIMNC